MTGDELPDGYLALEIRNRTHYVAFLVREEFLEDPDLWPQYVNEVKYALEHA